MFKDQDQAPQHTLAAGQSLQFWGKRGSTLQIEGGRAYLTEPGLWLSGPAQLEPVRLLNGHGHILRRSGWVVIYAALPCQLTVVAAPARASWGTRLLALLRGPVQAAQPGPKAVIKDCHP